MRTYPFILFLFLTLNSCSLDNDTEYEREQPELIISNLNLNQKVISEQTHISLQYLSYFIADLLGSSDIQSEIATYLASTGGNTIPTSAIFNGEAQFPMLKMGLDALLACSNPIGHHHRPGIDPGEGAKLIKSTPWVCGLPIKDTFFYKELIVNHITELYFPNGVSNLHIRSATSSPNLSLIRENEGYRFFTNDTIAEYYFNIEYKNEDVMYSNHNPMRINTANNYIQEKETKVIARITQW